MVEFRRAQKASAGPSFAAVVGQDELKEALLAVTANEALDGLLIRGEKGTAKSTTVRGLAEVLPDQRAVADCPYGCPPNDPGMQCRSCRERTDPPVESRSVPLVTLPLGATRERIVGSLSVADALDGEHEFEPGLLARANRGILYVDEVNLLDDHLVDVLLDAAAGGVNRVERDSVSVTHPADFTLVGTMNPEEGDLRPQLRDRFALQASVSACEELDDRVAVVRRALDDRDAADDDGGDSHGDRVRRRLAAARDRLDGVSLPRECVEEIAALCREAGVDGHRGDIAMARAARTFAALDGRGTVTEADLERAARLALPHRMQSRPFEDAPDPGDTIDDHFEDDSGDAGDGAGAEPDGDSGPEDGGAGADGPDDGSGTGAGDGPAGGDRADDAGDGSGTGAPDSAADPGDSDPDHDGETPAPSGAGASDGQESAGLGRDGTDGTGDADQPNGRSGDGDEGKDGTERPGEGDRTTEEGTPLVPGQSRQPVADAGESARPTLSPPETGGTDAGSGSRVSEDPAVGRDGPRVRSRPASDGGDVDAVATVRAAAERGSSTVESRDLRESVRAGQTGSLVVFAVDASASMRPAMRAAKGTVLELLEDAYQHRDEVAFVAFAGEDAEVLLPPTDSVTLAARHLKDLPTGDRTPLPAGLETAGEVLARADPDTGTVVLVTDGRANAAADPVAETRAAARSLARQDPRVLVVDAGEGGRAALTDLLVDETGGRRVPLDALSAERVDTAAGGAGERRG
jgi:magnesium chelatase subunit D